MEGDAGTNQLSPTPRPTTLNGEEVAPHVTCLRATRVALSYRTSDR
jgi:hypothetical protein